VTAPITFLRRAKTLLWTSLSIVIILCAVIVGLGKLFLPYTSQYQERLETWLSGELGQPVEIESISGDWKAFGPQLTLRGLALQGADGAEEIAVIEEAVIDIKPFNALIPSRALYNFRVAGANFHLVRLQDGSFEFYGLGVGGGDNKEPDARAGKESGLKQLASISEVILEDSSFKFIDEILQIDLNLQALNGRLQIRGDELSVQISSQFASNNSDEIYGEFEATARMLMDDEDRPVSAEWQLSTQELMLGQLRDQLPPNEFFPQQGRLMTQMWGSWGTGHNHRIRGVLDLRGARVVNDTLDRTVERLNTRFIAEFADSDDWRIDINEFVLDAGKTDVRLNSVAIGRHLARGAGLWVSADAVPVSFPADIAVEAVRIAGKEWPHFIPASGGGVVQDFEMILNEKMKLGSATGTFRRASVSDWGQWPDIANVDGRLEFGPGTGSLVLNGKGVVVEWPRMFDAPVTVDMPVCRVDFSWVPGEKGQYQVELGECAIENEFVSAHGELRFRGNTGKPAVDVVVRVDRLDVSQVGDYWPRDLMKPQVTDWLKSGLLEGQLESGLLQIYGDMDDWPFDNGAGRFETIVEIRDAQVDYFEGWPMAREVDATARFVNSGMDVSGRVGNIGGVEADSIRATISDFRTPELQVEYQSQSQLPEILAFLEETPVREKVNADLQEYEFEGPASTSGRLRVPLSEGSTGIDLDGLLELKGNRFTASQLDFSLDNIEGLVNYHQLGFHGEYIDAEYKGKSGALEVRAGGTPGPGVTDFNATQSENNNGFSARLVGMFDARDLIPSRIFETWTPLSRIQGSSLWEAEFRAGSDQQTEINLVSELRGIELGFPEPLRKPADEAWPFELRIPLESDSPVAEIRLDGRFNALMVMDENWSSLTKGTVAVGQGDPEMPSTGLLRLAGHTPALNLDDWVDLVIEQAREGKTLGGLRLESGSMTADSILFVDRQFDDVSMEYSVEQDSFAVDFDGETIDGNIVFVGMDGGNQSLIAEFERLVLDEPLKAGMQMDVDPASLPTLHLYARSLRYSGVELGETRIEAFPTAEGFRFEKVESESPDMNVRASGRWALENGSHRSSFEIRMTSESLGNFLRQLDIASPVEGGQTMVEFDVWWDGSPGQFKLARLNGDVNFNVNSGVIKDASPGTGRLLGLLSIQALPRRLALDFRDVFDSGFAFDEAIGSFEMLNGSARTDDVTLKSSAAQISFSGTTNLVDQEFDQLITVRPGLGNTLPVIGAIAGGPGGAAAGLALQGLLHQQLGEASQVQYTLKGAWDKPEIEPVLKSASDG